MAAPIVAPLVRWFVLGFAASVGWKLGNYVIDKLKESEWLSKEAEETLKDIKCTWTGRPGDLEELKDKQ